MGNRATETSLHLKFTSNKETTNNAAKGTVVIFPKSGGSSSHAALGTYDMKIKRVGNNPQIMQQLEAEFERVL